VVQHRIYDCSHGVTLTCVVNTELITTKHYKQHTKVPGCSEHSSHSSSASPGPIEAWLNIAGNTPTEHTIKYAT